MLAIVGICSAYTLQMTIEDKDGTKLEATNVQILKGQTLISEQKADRFGNVTFELDAGTYFIHPIRGYYPDNVVLIVLSKDEQRTIIILKEKPTYTLYGQIIGDTLGQWDGAKLYAVDENGAKFGETTVAAEGYYAMTSLYPSKTYRLKLAGGEGKVSSLFSYDGEGAYYLQMDLRNSSVFVDVAPLLSAPSVAQLYSQIYVSLRSAGKPVAGKEIIATTPAGQISITTDEQGIAMVQAAGEGKYLFEYGNQTVQTIVGVQKAPVPIVEKKPVPEPPIAVQQKPAAQNQDVLIMGIGSAGLIMAIGLIFGVALVGVIAYFLTRKKENVVVVEQEPIMQAQKEEMPVHHEGHPHHEKHMAGHHAHGTGHEKHGHQNAGHAKPHHKK